MPTANKTKSRTQARARMQRMRERRSAAKIAEIRGIILPPELAKKVQLEALFTNSRSPSELVAKATQIYVEKQADDTFQLLRVIHSFWPQIRAYKPYLKELLVPCPPCVVNGVPYTHEQASRFAKIYDDIKHHMRTRGVTIVNEALDAMLDEICRVVNEQKLFETKPLANHRKPPQIQLRA